MQASISTNYAIRTPVIFSRDIIRFNSVSEIQNEVQEGYQEDLIHHSKIKTAVSKDITGRCESVYESASKICNKEVNRKHSQVIMHFRKFFTQEFIKTLTRNRQTKRTAR